MGYLGKEGMISMTGLAMVVVELMVFVLFLPTISSWINDALPYFADNVLGTWLMRLIPLFLLMALTFGMFNNNNQG